MKVWLDDTRPAPPGWEWVRTVSQATSLLKTGQVTHISLDYHLDRLAAGHQVAEFIMNSAQDGSLPRLTWEIHSTDLDGCYRMELALHQANVYWSI